MAARRAVAENVIFCPTGTAASITTSCTSARLLASTAGSRFARFALAGLLRSLLFLLFTCHGTLLFVRSLSREPGGLVGPRLFFGLSGLPFALSLRCGLSLLILRTSEGLSFCL